MIDQTLVAAHLREVAAYLWLEGEPFRARAYQRAAETVASLPDLERTLGAGQLVSLPRIGASLASAIEELATRGTMPLLERLRLRWPATLVALSRLPGLGEQKARRLYEQLGVATVEELADACRAGKVRELPGFGARTEAKLLAALEAEVTREPEPRPMLLPEARELAAQIVQHLAGAAVARTIEPTGQVRRWQEIVDTIEVAVATDDPATLRAHLERSPLVASLEAGSPDAPARARLAGGAALLVHTAPPADFGRTLVRSTGSEAHWLELRARAARRGVELEALGAHDEQAVYAALELPWLPPELREGPDELAVAVASDPLVELADVRGLVHCHTTYSDGKGTIEEMARAALALGFDYLTITDHSRSAHYAGGLGEDELRRQWDEIDEVSARVGIRLFKGTEADILADGALDWPDVILERLEVVIASVHQRHKLDEAQMTDRLVRAMRHPFFKIWGHPLGRLLLSREPFACRVEEVLDAIAAAPAAIEINGDPRRLDLAPRWARRARARGIPFVLSSDAHSTGALRSVEYAVAMARRAGAGKAEVLNTLTAEAFARAVHPVGALRTAPGSRELHGAPA